MFSLVSPLLALFVLVIIMVARRPATLLKQRGAVSPETAQPLAELGSRDRARLREL